MRFELLRTERTSDGVFGELFSVEGAEPRLRLVTVEDDWRDNLPKISCIPAGIYVLRRTIYHKHNYETFEVTNVPGRKRILFHPANTEDNVEGCIGVGLRRGTLRVAGMDKDAVVESKAAHHQFMEALTGLDEATLEILWLEDLKPTAVA